MSDSTERMSFDEAIREDRRLKRRRGGGGRIQNLSPPEERTDEDGQVYHSKAEFIRGQELRVMEQARVIEDLRRQPAFELSPAYDHPSKGRIKPEYYLADFSYAEIETGLRVVEDVKGHETDLFKSKWKRVQKLYPDVDFRKIPAKEVFERWR